MRPIKKGSTSQSVIVRVIDSTSGLPETTVAYNTAGVALWYRREGAVKTSITAVTLATLDAAYSSGGFLHIGDGYCRIDLPDSALATGSNGVMIGGVFTGMIVIGVYVPLLDYDPQDAIRLGLTALPNAAADAAGGLPISDAGALDLDTKLANTNEITLARMGALTDLIDGGRLDLIFDIIAADTTTDIPALLATAQADLDILTGTDGATLATLQGNYAPNKVVPDAAGTAASLHSTTDAHLTDIKGTGFVKDTDSLPQCLTAIGFSTLTASDVNTEVDTAWDTAIGTPTTGSRADYLKRMKFILCNKWTIDETTGDSDIYDDSDILFNTKVGAFASLAGVTIREKVI